LLPKLRNISYIFSLVLRRKEGKNYAMLNGHRWFLQKKQKGLGINYIIDKNHGLITLP
jgi:hypothetical protein